MKMCILFLRELKKIGSEMGYVIDFHDSNEKIKNISDDDIKNTIQIAEKYDFIIIVVGDNSMRYKWSQKTA